LAGEGLQVVSVADPRRPTAVGYLESWWIHNLDVEGDFVYTLDEDAGLNIISVELRNRPRKVATFEDFVYGLGIDAVGARVYVSGIERELEVYSVVDKANPVRIESVFVGGEASDIQVIGEHAYVAAGSAGLAVVRISDAGPAPTPIPGAIRVYLPSLSRFGYLQR
jgi:hypothetical protein